MALTRKSLKAMGLNDEQIDSVVEMHAETVDGLKEQLKTAEEKANQFDSVKKELDELKAKPSDDYEAKYKDEHKAFEDYKKSVEEEKKSVARDEAAKAYFESKNITGTNAEIAMRGAKEEIDALIVEDGKIKDTAALDALIGGTFAGLVVKKSASGVNTATPPANNVGAYDNMSVADKMKRLNEHPDERQAILDSIK